MKNPPVDYVVQPARFHYWEPKEPDNFTGMHFSDDVYKIPCEWIVANASRFYFTNKQIIDAALPELVEPDTNSHCRLYVIYFLISGGEIIYVGQSSCPEIRMEQHLKKGMRFDSVTWFEAPAMHLDDIEAYYIWRCNPIMNNKWPTSSYFGNAAKLLDDKYGEKRNNVEYVTTIHTTLSLPWQV